jgi:hypothetical protein
MPRSRPASVEDVPTNSTRTRIESGAVDPVAVTVQEFRYRDWPLGRTSSGCLR